MNNTFLTVSKSHILLKSQQHIFNFVSDLYQSYFYMLKIFFPFINDLGKYNKIC